MAFGRKKWNSPYIDTNSRKNKRKNQKDQYGIYESKRYPIKKNKKKAEFTVRHLIRIVLMGVIFLVVIYAVSFGVKYSMMRKGISQYEKEDYESASNLFVEALKPNLPLLERLDNNVRLYLADCYVNMGEYGQACYMYGQVRLWATENVEGLSYLSDVAYGLQLYEWKEYREALPVLLKAYEDGYQDLVLYVGSCYGQIGDLDNMQIYYDIFLKNNAMNSFMYAQYASVALDGNRLDEAYEYIEQGKQLEDQSNLKELLFDEIVYYEKRKDYNTAYEKASVFIKEYPDDEDGKNEYDYLYTRQTITE